MGHSTEKHSEEITALLDKISGAVEMILEYGPYDGAHHKDWVLDQALRKLLGTSYSSAMPEDWEEGVAP
jgi:hypothetical protein